MPPSHQEHAADEHQQQRGDGPQPDPRGRGRRSRGLDECEPDGRAECGDEDHGIEPGLHARAAAHEHGAEDHRAEDERGGRGGELGITDGDPWWAAVGEEPQQVAGQPEGLAGDVEEDHRPERWAGAQQERQANDERGEQDRDPGQRGRQRD